MNTLTTYRLKFDATLNEEALLKGVYLVVIHATRVPPHIGLIINKHYHSLTIKGQDNNTPVKALLKNIEQRELPTLFIKIKPHNTFSEMYQREHFISNIAQFPRVDIGVATCLSPVKLFFEEVYDVAMKEVNYLYELLPALSSAGLIEHTGSLFVKEQNYTLPFYTDTEIVAGIEEAKKEMKKMKEEKRDKK